MRVHLAGSRRAISLLSLVAATAVLATAGPAQAIDPGDAPSTFVPEKWLAAIFKPFYEQGPSFDFTDCQVGLRNSHFYLNFKGNCVSAELLDITTGVSYGTGVETRGGIVFYCVNDCESLKGHVLQLVIRNDARKVVNVEVQRSVCYCGP